MPQLAMPRREFARIPVAMTAATLLPERYQPRRVVALDWIVRNSGQVIIPDRLIGSVNPAGR